MCVWCVCVCIHLYIYIYIYICVCVCVCVCVFSCTHLSVDDNIRGAYDKFPDFFRMDTFIDSTHMKHLSASK